MKWIAPALIALMLFATAGLWAYSHADPASAGNCRQVVVRFGSRPTVRECEPYGLADFGVPLGVVLFLLLLMTDGDYTVETPLVTLTLKKRAVNAVGALTAAATGMEGRAQGGDL